MFLHASAYEYVTQSLYQSFSDRAEYTSYNWFHCYFHVSSFFISLARSRHLSFILFSFSLTHWSTRTAKSTIRQVLFFLLLTITRSDRLAEIRWSVYILKSKWFCLSQSPGLIQGCSYNILHMVIIIIIIIIIYSLEVFWWLADGLSLESEW